MLRIAMSLLLLELAVPGLRGVPRQRDSDLEASLHRHVTAYTLNADSFVDALAKLATRFGIPMGIEWYGNTEAARKVSLSWINSDPERMIRKLVGSQRGYEFDVSGGVVHVFSAKDRSSRQDFVNLKIREFIVRDEAPEIATRRLRDLVKLTVSPPPPSDGRGGSVYSQAGEVGERNISLRLRNVTVRNALDRISLASDWKIWVVTFTDGPLTSTGFRPTRTLWIRNIPNGEQPVWDSLRWGSEIPPQR